jgi:hypothetical protein
MEARGTVEVCPITPGQSRRFVPTFDLDGPPPSKTSRPPDLPTLADHRFGPLIDWGREALTEMKTKAILPSNHPDELVNLVISLAEDEGLTKRGAANKIWRAAGRDHNRISETTREAIVDLGDDVVAGDKVAIRVLAILYLAESRSF